MKISSIALAILMVIGLEARANEIKYEEYA